MVERDHSIADNGIDDDLRAQCVELLDEHKIDAMVQLRRTTLAAHSAGLAAVSVGASTGAGAAATKLGDTVRHIEGQALHMGEDYVTGELENVLDSPDVDANEGIRPNSLVFEGIGDGARAIVGDEGSTKSCFTDSVAQVRSTVATVASLLMTPGQLKLVLGNLQINAYVKTDTIQPRRVASLSLSRSLWLTLYHCCLRYTYSYRSLTVVFNIPWPPVHMRFINFLSVFKLDLFKGLSFMAPCLHSSHFMSLASFVAAVRT
jgi:hypothetical protein